MKKLKLFGLALIASLGLSILAGAGAAQATVLCTTEDTSECTMPYSKGTAVDMSLKSGTTMALRSTGGALEATCTESAVKGKTGAETSVSVPVELSEWSWSGCGHTADAVAAGSLEIKRIEGTHNGTVTGSGNEWLFEIVAVKCTYGTGSGTDLGTLTGGAEPVLKVNAVINKLAGSFLCASTVKFEAELVVTEPHALYVI